MSFIDEHPLDWPRPEVPQLRDLFVRAYKREINAEGIADLAGIVPGTFPYHDNMRTTWTELMNVMALQGKLRKMVEVASNDPTTAYQQRFAEMLEEHPSVPRQIPKSGDWWKGPDQDVNSTRKLHLERLLEKRSQIFDINLAYKVTLAAQSVAKLVLHFEGEKAYGTGFLIQPNLILTNYHNVFHERYGDIKAVTAEFDYVQRFLGSPIVRQGKVDNIVKNAEHDWAVVELVDKVDRDPLALGTPYTVSKDDTVIIIQHPLGAFKQFSIDPLSIQYVDEEDKIIIQYLADTQDGSSGSPVFNVELHPIALHHAEAEEKIEINGREEIVYRNEGILMDKVMEGLQANGIEFKRNK
ncbi:MAG: hypothetical protein CL609_07620 [Anaerolineaceae bacterium]|nr:hypothetical protein [Anaerolineaceae bacterium]